MDAQDKSVKATDSEVRISCVFDDLPSELIIDASHSTTLQEEYLLNADGLLEIVKVYKIQKTVVGPETYIRCMHPTAEKIERLHQCKLSELRSLGKELGVEEAVADKRIAALWRKALWESADDLGLSDTQLDIGTLEKESKAIYKKIDMELPVFALFKADRESVDGDPEAKNPIQTAVDQAKKALQAEIEELQKKVEESVLEVANRTKEKIKEIDPALASELHPRFKDKPKWTFNFTLDGEGGVPINKRGSGVRRLILLNFFRAEAEKKRVEQKAPKVIYAIEEPETSQHPNYQLMLIEALLDLSSRPECQILLTTHVPGLAGLLPIESIRYIESDQPGFPNIQEGTEDVLQKATESLGILPEAEIATAKAVLLVEGHSDVTFVNHSSSQLSASGHISDSLQNRGIAPIPIGGCGNLKHWVSKRLIEELGLDWAVLMDSDIGDAVQNERNIKKIQELSEQGKIALLTRKREPENYIDPDIIRDERGVEVSYTDTCDAKKIIATALTIRKEDVLERFWPMMTAEQILRSCSYADEGETVYEIPRILERILTLVDG